MATKPSAFLALLRGINVGGRNVIAKDDLRQCFEDLGCTNVRTYIQSGNILFRSSVTGVEELTEAVETGLSDRFSYHAQAVVLSRKKYQTAVAAAPDGWGVDADRKHNALFTLKTITPKQVLAQLPAPKTDLETVTVGPHVVYWSISKQHQSKTTLMKLSAHPVYQQLTVRNHNTVFKLFELFKDI